MHGHLNVKKVHTNLSARLSIMGLGAIDDMFG